MARRRLGARLVAVASSKLARRCHSWVQVRRQIMAFVAGHWRLGVTLVTP
jgi:hypothetical protein